MTSDSINEVRPHVSRRVRAAGVSAAIGAAFLLYFGFARLAEPESTDLFSLSNLVMYHAARWGGLLMVAIAVWLWTGHIAALLADGVVATLIGVVLVVTGLGMGVGGGDIFQALINFVCGYMFYSSGVQNGKEYFALSRRSPAKPSTEARTPAPLASGSEEASDADSIEKTAPQPKGRDDLPTSPPRESQSVADPDPSSPPAGGYLASFAKRDPSDDS